MCLQIESMVENLVGLEPSDIQKISVSILNHWINTENQKTDVHTLNAKIRNIKGLLKISRNKTSNEPDVLTGKFLSKCLEIQDLNEEALVEAVEVLCSGQSREEAW